MTTRARSFTRAAPDDTERHIPDLPARVDRRTGAALITQHFFPVSPRSLEAWPVVWQHVNGRAVGETAQLFAVAQAKLDAAPPVRGGRRAAGQGA